MDNILADLNKKLKEVKSFEEFKQLEKEINSYGMGYSFWMKRRQNFYAYAFEFVRGKVDYLISDSVSTGLCNVENLYRVMEIR